MAYLSKDEYHELFSYRKGNLYWTTDIRIGQKMLGKRAGWFNSTNGYTCVTVLKRKQVVQRIVWIMHNGDIPPKMQIDHINRIKTDNRIENLRLATATQNAYNREKIKKTKKHKGVFPFQQKQGMRYVAFIRVNKVQKNLGYYTTEDDAARAYNKKAKELYGEFAVLNEVGGG